MQERLTHETNSAVRGAVEKRVSPWKLGGRSL
jgi:hypothetical protein